MKYILLLALFILVGCGEEAPKSPYRMRSRFNHDVGSGHPHRMTVLQDGTEILTLGDHDNPNVFILLLRYADEERFTIYNLEGKIPGEVKEVIETNKK